MKHKIISITSISAIIGLLSVSAAWLDQNLYVKLVAEQTEELTERQETIMADQEMGASLEELSDEQKYAIARADLMLEHLETRYGKEFVYHGFVGSSFGETETLYAYPADGDDYLDVCTVTAQDGARENHFTDNYMNIFARRHCRDFVLELLDGILPESTGRFVGVKVERVDAQDPDTYLAYDPAAHTEMQCDILLDGRELDAAAFDGVTESILTEMERFGISGTVRIHRMNVKNIQAIDEYNFDKFIGKQQNYVYQTVTAQLSADRYPDLSVEGTDAQAAEFRKEEAAADAETEAETQDAAAAEEEHGQNSLSQDMAGS